MELLELLKILGFTQRESTTVYIPCSYYTYFYLIPVNSSCFINGRIKKKQTKPNPNMIELQSKIGARITGVKFYRLILAL